MAIDEPHLLTALRYVALNPVRARLVERAQDWQWSSVHALLDPARADGITASALVLERVSDCAALLRSGEDERLSAALRQAETIGRPFGNSAFLDRAPLGDLTWYVAGNWREFENGPTFLSVTPGVRTHLGGKLFLLGGIEIPVTNSNRFYREAFTVQLVQGF